MRFFSSSDTSCQKYCDTLVSTSSSAICSCNLLTSSPTRANLLPLTICPPAKTGCKAVTLARVPCFIIAMLIGSPNEARASGGIDWASAAPNAGGICSAKLMFISAMALLALNHRPVALTLGKNLVKASLRCWWAASTPSRPLEMATLLARAESISCSQVYVCCAETTSPHTQQATVRNAFFMSL